MTFRRQPWTRIRVLGRRDKLGLIRLYSDPSLNASGFQKEAHSDPSPGEKPPGMGFQKRNSTDNPDFLHPGHLVGDNRALSA
jgi:hypothetical protein